jgi:site-specific DNA-methyltransferase (adenine-specific)
MFEINKIYNENCMATTKRIADNSIDCIITSPPYWQCRDYGYPEQWGLEPTFYEYLEHLWEFMDESYRILKPEGTCFINLGDTYGGSKKGNDDKKHNNQVGNNVNKNDGVNKCLLLLPHRFAIGCIDSGWIMRNDCVWAKRNGMPESVTDRFSKKHEYFFFMVKSEKYYFDLDSIKDRTTTKDTSVRNRDITKLNNTPGRTKMKGLKENNYDFKNPGSVSDFWDVPTHPSSEEHYASYNEMLLKKLVLGGCPEGGVIYDPFMGTGETAVTAIKYKRQFVGSDGNKKYCQIAERRIKQHLARPKSFFNL